MSEFIHGELVETTKDYIAKPGVELKPGKKRFGIIIEPKADLDNVLDQSPYRNNAYEDTVALVQWADNSEEKVFHYEIDKVIK